jgi:hypothetical protein
LLCCILQSCTRQVAAAAADRLLLLVPCQLSLLMVATMIMATMSKSAMFNTCHQPSQPVVCKQLSGVCSIQGFAAAAAAAATTAEK